MLLMNLLLEIHNGLAKHIVTLTPEQIGTFAKVMLLVS